MCPQESLWSQHCCCLFRGGSRPTPLREECGDIRENNHRGKNLGSLRLADYAKRQFNPKRRVITVRQRLARTANAIHVVTGKSGSVPQFPRPCPVPRRCMLQSERPGKPGGTHL